MKLTQFGIIEYDNKTKFSLLWLRRLLASKPISRELKIAVASQRAIYIALNEKIKKLDEELAKQALNNPEDEKIIRSVPGVGPLSARVILNEVGNICRFKNTREMASFTGLKPSEFSSGDKVHKGRISRVDNARIRCCLTEVAWRAIKIDKKLTIKYEQLKQRCGGKKDIVAIARKLMISIRSCLINREMYQLEA